MEGGSGLRLDGGGGIAGLEIVKRTLHKRFEAQRRLVWTLGIRWCGLPVTFFWASLLLLRLLFLMYPRHIFLVRWGRSKKHEGNAPYAYPRHVPKQEL